MTIRPGGAAKHGERLRGALEALIAARAVSDFMRPGSNLYRLYEAQAGLAAATYDSDLVAHMSSSDPTGMSIEAGPDQPAKDLSALDAELAAFVLHGDRVRRILAAYGPPRTAGEADRLALMRVNTRPDPRCEHCATVESTNGTTGGHWSDADHRRKGPTTVGGRLSKEMTLCAWCVNFTEANGHLPSVEQLEAHRDGRRVMVKDQTSRRLA